MLICCFPFCSFYNLDFVEGKILKLIPYYLHKLNVFIFLVFAV